MPGHDFISQESEKTYKRLKPLNRALSNAKTRAEKDKIEAEIKAIKDEWFKVVGPALSEAYRKTQEEFDRQRLANMNRLLNKENDK